MGIPVHSSRRQHQRPKEKMMLGKYLFLSFFIILFDISFSKAKEIECYVQCVFVPADKDSPDLTKCKKEKCKYGCGREGLAGTHVSDLPSGGIGKDISSGAGDEAMDTMTNLLPGGNKLKSIKLGCVNDGAESKNCGKLKDGKGLCVCKKPLCNSAPKILPVTFILLPLWTIAMIR